MEKSGFRINAGYVIGTLLFAAILIVIVVMKPLSFFHVRGSSMNPTLYEDDLVFCLNTKNLDYEDIVAFKHNDTIMIKRVIGKGGDSITIDEEGNVYRNDELLEEEYVEKKGRGNPDVEYPYLVPENTYFVLGDNRTDSLDSRNIIIGSVKEVDIIGKILFKNKK